ncbi:hypothetical protein PQO01_03155 [Lentisphaera marina]|uniref:hypothetical protein n=1 Tax=Lentisphaera marina TaxID=1111041 RepID=UPI00236631AD|nr:hypothetical protein [Lentisphaera marina]MDD7983947.1 hypothetical protein [Lentisphaera marina]
MNQLSSTLIFAQNRNGWLTALTENSDDAHKDKHYYNRINVDRKYYPNDVKKDNTKINTQTNLELDGGVWFSLIQLIEVLKKISFTKIKTFAFAEKL